MKGYRPCGNNSAGAFYIQMNLFFDNGHTGEDRVHIKASGKNKQCDHRDGEREAQSKMAFLQL